MNTDAFKLMIYTSMGAIGGTFLRPISFTLTKERYTPFFTLDFVFDADDYAHVSVIDIAKVELLFGDLSIFYGRTAGIRLSLQSGRPLISGKAYGFTKTLATSDAVPGMMFDCTLADLAAANTVMPNVSYQQASDSASYIYVKESDTIWSAIAALSIKLYENYPYITAQNTVNIKKEGQASLDYTDEKVTEIFSGNSFNNAVSKIYMQGTQGTYDYSCTDSEVIRRGIRRDRYIPLDRQWLSDPEMGLKHKMYFSRRGGAFRGFTYQGFKNEQLCDSLSFSCAGTRYSGEVSKLTVKGDRKGVFTTVISYHDGYSLIGQAT